MVNLAKGKTYTGIKSGPNEFMKGKGYAIVSLINGLTQNTPDLSHIISFLSIFIHNPRHGYPTVAKEELHYLKETEASGITYIKYDDELLNFGGYGGSDYAGF